MLHKDETKLRESVFPLETKIEKLVAENARLWEKNTELRVDRWKYRWLRETGVTIMVPGHGAVYLQGEAMDEWMSANVPAEPGEGFGQADMKAEGQQINYGKQP